MKPVVLIHGKPGLGKSTLAKSVALALQKSGVKAAHFSIGEQLRAISSGETESRYSKSLRAAHEVLYKHAHVTDPAIIHGVIGEFLEGGTDEIVVIDGHPRYMDITTEYEVTLNRLGWHTVLVVIIEGSDELARDRIEKRHRGEDGITEDPAWRLADYEQTMAPVLAWLAANYPTIHIDARNELEQKTHEVCSRIGGQ